MKSIKGSSQLIKLLLIALGYLAILGLAWWFVTTKNQNAGSATNSNDSSRISRTTDVFNLGHNSNRNTPNSYSSQTNSIVSPSNNRNSDNESKIDLQRVEDDRINWRAKISYPRDGAIVKTDDGWVQAQGSIKPINPGESLFIVVESTTQKPPVIYLQSELRPTADGFWNANVKYGSLGYEYYTYVISAINEDAAAEVRELVNFKILPLGVKRISRKYLNLVK